MDAGARQRIDKWLFFARVVKSRSLAAKLAASGKVRVNRDKIVQPAHQVKVGDVLTITLERRILVYKVLAPGARRPGPEAQLSMKIFRRHRPLPRLRSRRLCPSARAGRATNQESGARRTVCAETDTDALPQAARAGDGNFTSNRSGESLFHGKGMERNAVSDVREIVLSPRFYPCQRGIKSLPHALS